MRCYVMGQSLDKRNKVSVRFDLNEGREMDFDFDGGFSKLSSFDIDLSFNSPTSPPKKSTNPVSPPRKAKKTQDLEESKFSTEDLQFDPLSKSSQNAVAAVSQSETFGQEHSRRESRCPELVDETQGKTVENHQRETAIPESRELTLPASGPSMPVTTRSSGDHSGNTDTVQKSELQTVIEMPVKFSPAIAALPLNDSKEMQKDEEDCEPAFNQNSACVTLEQKGKDSISTHAPTVSLKTAEKLRGDHAEGKQSKAREDLGLGQLKSKTAQSLGNSVMMLLRNKNHISNQKEQTFCASKRPSSELSETTNYPQSGLQRTSPIHSEDDQGDSCRDTHVRTKREKGQRLLHNVVGFPTLTPVDGIRQGLEVQSPITTALRARNQLTSRTLTTSRFFANDLPTSTEREVGHQIHSPRPDLGKSSKLISSATCHTRTQTQPSKLVIDENAVRKISGTSEVSKSEDFQTNSSRRDNIKIRGSGNITETLFRPQPHSSGRSSLQARELSEHAVQAERSRQNRPSAERVEDPAPSCEEVQNQNLPMSTETPVGQVPAHSSADWLISKNNNIVELSIQQTENLVIEEPVSSCEELLNQNFPMSTETPMESAPGSADLLISENNNIVELSIQQTEKLDAEESIPSCEMVLHQNLPMCSEAPMGHVLAYGSADLLTNENKNIVKISIKTEKLVAEDPVPSCAKVENQNLPMSTEPQIGHVPAHGSAELLISENKPIVELAAEQTEMLDAMLNVLRKLNDDAKDLFVRALVTNNKLMMLDNPVTEYKISFHIQWCMVFLLFWCWVARKIV
ncbi:unnamed protein product [Calypogeia fissa]